MHDLVLDFVRDAPPGHALARNALDDGALLALFAAEPWPRWVAKTACGEFGCRRLRREAQALGWLEPFAPALALPRLLGWSDPASADGSAGGNHADQAIGPAAPDRVPQCCLVQSGLPGAPRGWEIGAGRLPAGLDAALGWLRRFQHRVPAPRSRSLADLAAELRFAMVARPDSEGLGIRLLPHFPQCPQAAPASPAHGDFWCGNLLFGSGGLLGVVDWSAFDSSSALDDPLTLLLHSPCRRHRRRLEGLDHWRFVFFEDHPPRRQLREWARAAGYSVELARFAFFWFCARRLRWELGCALQSRDAAERRASARAWSERIDWMERQNWPDPFTSTC